VSTQVRWSSRKLIPAMRHILAPARPAAKSRPGHRGTRPFG
jgi:hypothetical protein